MSSHLISEHDIEQFQGSGEPAPTISWRREGQSLPDGSSLIAGDQLIFSQVGRDHAGTYVCTGHTDQARHRVRDMVEVVVQCKYNKMDLL